MSILFLLASLGVINGAMVGLYLVLKKSATPSDRYFGGLLLVLVVRIGKSVFFYFNPETDRLILQIGLSACVFIGPFFFLYAKALQQSARAFRRLDIILLITLLVLIFGIGIRFPYRAYPEVWNGYIIYGIYAVWLVFFVMGLYICIGLLKGAKLSAKSMSPNQQYLLAMMIAMLFITFTYQASLFVGFTYIWGSLIFTLAFYYLSARVLLSRRPITPKVTTPALENGPELMKRVDDLMLKDKPFVQQGLKLDELAVMAGLSKHTLSKLLNEEYKLGFSHYVKSHRVEETKGLILTRSDLSLEGIGYEAGFKSKSAFFEAFKAMVNCTPAAYKRANGMVRERKISTE